MREMEQIADEETMSFSQAIAGNLVEISPNGDLLAVAGKRDAGGYGVYIWPVPASRR
jgi:hypothetical protein